MDTGNDKKLVKVGKNYEIRHVEGNPDKKLDDTELAAIPNHVLRGIFDTNADGLTKRNEYQESNVKYLAGIDIPVGTLMDTIAEGPAKPTSTPKNDTPTKGGRIK